MTISNHPDELARRLAKFGFSVTFDWNVANGFGVKVNKRGSRWMYFNNPSTALATCELCGRIGTLAMPVSQIHVTQELINDMIERGRFLSSIAEEWELYRKTPKRWAVIRRAYAYMTPRIFQNYRTSPYFLDWLPAFTPIEYDAWQSIRQIGLPMFPQYPVGRYFVDFGDPKKKIAIECDGKQWHNPEKDAKRDSALMELGWYVYHFSGSSLWKGEDNEEAAHHGIKQIFETHYRGADE